MAEEPTPPPEGKKAKGSFMKKKIGGVPAPVILIVGGVLAYYLYSKYKSGQAASTSSAATPAAAATGIDPTTGLPYAAATGIDPTTGLPYAPSGTPGGYVGTGGGYASTPPTGIDPTTGLPYLTTASLPTGVDPNAVTSGANTGGTTYAQSPTNTSQFTPAPPASLVSRSAGTLTIAQAQARIATTQRDIAAAKKMAPAGAAKLKSAQNALITQTATLNKLKAAGG